MRIFLLILKVIAIIVLVLGVLFAGLYYFGSLRLIQPTTLQLRDGGKVEFTVQNGWCAVDPVMLGLNNIPVNTLFIKRGACKVRDLTSGIKMSELVQVRVNLLSDATEENYVIELCAKNAYGLSGYKKDGAIYCLGAPKDDTRGITAFREVGGKYMTTTAFFLLNEVDRNIQLKQLEYLVNSYRVKK